MPLLHAKLYNRLETVSEGESRYRVRDGDCIRQRRRPGGGGILEHIAREICDTKNLEETGGAADAGTKNAEGLVRAYQSNHLSHVLLTHTLFHRGQRIPEARMMSVPSTEFSFGLS
ncbi:hypothetical protein BDV93DRAFT_512089 [Ceratobasidium sp. AG-I]|nr:hypothetical protein BDV93DRAFT_512089 [Ceratobasidium sp. AG-I]